jgi:Ca2+-binding EF-hand superfamily protein
MKNLTKIALSCALLTTAAGAYAESDSGKEHRARFSAMIEKRFAELDKNQDGKVSLGEFRSEQYHRFWAADANKDGQLTQAEIDA